MPADPPRHAIGPVSQSSERIAAPPAEAIAAYVDHIRRQERERIARAIEAEADMTACDEDAGVTRGLAWLVRADFSYEDAERLQDEAEAAERRAQLNDERRADKEAAEARAARRDEPGHAPDPSNPYGPF